MRRIKNENVFAGTVTTGMADFPGTRNFIQSFSLYTVSEAYTAMCHVVEECATVAAMNLYTPNFGKFVPLDEFEMAQTHNSFNVSKFHSSINTFLYKRIILI